MYPFVTVQTTDNVKVSICVYDISMFCESRNGYSRIILKTSGNVIETKHSYQTLEEKIAGVYLP